MAHGLRLPLPSDWRFEPRDWWMEDQLVENIGRIGMFAITFALGWLVMIWGWGGWVGGLLGWIPAVVLAAILAPIWRMVIAGGATVVLLLMVARIL